MRVNSSRLAGDPAKKNFGSYRDNFQGREKKFENQSDQFLPAITVPRVALKRVEPAAGGGGGRPPFPRCKLSL